MFNLIGFWGAVTLIIMPTVLLAYWLLEGVINMEVKHLSKRKYKFEPFDDYLTKLFRKASRNNNDVPMVIFMIISVVCSIIAVTITGLGGMVDCDTGVRLSMLEAVSNMAMTLAPVTTWITTPLLIAAVYSLTVRKLLVKLFDLKEKVDNL
ncbi:MAG: hypothetical protein ACRC6R_05985 [Bacteroidales bacterium]